MAFFGLLGDLAADVGVATVEAFLGGDPAHAPAPGHGELQSRSSTWENTKSLGALVVGGVAGKAAFKFVGKFASLFGRGGACFVGGTLVETVSGLRRIEEIDVGDIVWSRDDGTGEEGWKPVVQTFITPDQVVFDLDLVEADGDEQELIVTAEHPLWTKSGWVAVGDLANGESIWARDGWAEVISVADGGPRQTVYNFEVADFHTYFVGEGGVWAHNTCFPNAKNLAN